MARRMSLFAVLVVLALAAAGYGALHYMTAVPGKPHRGALPPLTAEETALAIMAEITAVRYGREGEFMRRKAPALSPS